MSAQSQAKQNAARRAAEIISDQLQRINSLGIGTGSTVRLVLEHLMSSSYARRLLGEKSLYVSSLDTFYVLRDYGFEPQLVVPRTGLDLYFDGADEVVIASRYCDVVKGRGAALTREKILAYNSRKVVLVVDETKLAKKLGEHNKPLPIEVVPAAADAVLAFLYSQGVKASLRMGCKCRDGPAITDNYGLIVDAWPWSLEDIRGFIERLERVPGVIDHGFFSGFVDKVVVGYQDRVSVFECLRTEKNPALA